MSGKITVIGSANVDFIMPVPHLPGRGESVNGGPFRQSFGGKGSNQALAARKAGAEVAAVFNLGGDAFAEEILAAHRNVGVDVTHIRLNPGLSCGSGVILVDANGDNAIGTDLGANALLSVEQIDAAEEMIAGSSLVMLQMEIGDAAIQRAIDVAARRGVDVMLNFAPARETTVPLSEKIAILVVNEIEAGFFLSGRPIENPERAMEAAAALAEKGHRHVVVTLGERGCVAWSEGMARHIPAFAVKAVDATGAGDTFCGALAAALAEGRPFERAAVFANAAGALCATRPGAMPSIPRRHEIDDFLSSFREP